MQALSVNSFLTKALNNTFTIFNVNVYRSTLKESCDWILSKATEQAIQKTTCHFVNADCLNKAYFDTYYRHILNNVDRVFADGSGVRLACKIKGLHHSENINGTDLFPQLCQLASKNQANTLKIYLLGAKPTVAKNMQRRMQKLFPKVDFVGEHHGYFKHEDCQHIIDDINASKANLLLVGLGAPRQEIWINTYRGSLNTAVCMGVGGLFDYYSGNIPRAPQWMRTIGYEWVWRFMQEPKRLAKRYLVGNLMFVARVLKEHRQQTTQSKQVLNPIFNTAQAQTLNNKKYSLSTYKRKLIINFRIISRIVKQAFQRIGKRLIDVSAASLALILLSPLLAVTLLLIYCESPGNVFFSQQRVGKKGRVFKLWKFRSMKVNAETILKDIEAQNEMDGGVTFKMKHDPRITRVGKFIRKYSIDELPQLWNVLNGSMSLVGPRPALVNEVAQYEPKDRQRLLVKPGITCIWQVSGRSDIPFEQQVELDHLYISKRSIVTDIKLMLATIPAVLTARGAY